MYFSSWGWEMYRLEKASNENDREKWLSTLRRLRRIGYRLKKNKSLQNSCTVVFSLGKVVTIRHDEICQRGLGKFANEMGEIGKGGQNWAKLVRSFRFSEIICCCHDLLSSPPRCGKELNERVATLQRLKAQRSLRNTRQISKTRSCRLRILRCRVKPPVIESRHLSATSC